MYARIMVILLALLWGWIAFTVTHRTPPSPDGLVLPADTAAALRDPATVLQKQIGDIAVKDVELQEALATICRRGDVNIVAKWPRLHELDIDPQERISLTLFDASVQTALRGIFECTRKHPAYGITADGTIIVTSKHSDAPLLLAVHDTRDIAPNAAPLSLPSFIPGYGSAGGGIFQNAQPLHNEMTDEQEALISTLIQSLGQPAWIAINGGRDDERSGGSRVTIYAGRLITLLPPESDREVRDMLRQIRHKQSRTGAGRPNP